MGRGELGASAPEQTIRYTMSPIPRVDLEDQFVEGMRCPVCDGLSLEIVHVRHYPDFVRCWHCESAFVVDQDSQWVMYGKLPPEFPETSRMALRQWLTIEAVAQRAATERERSEAAAEVAREQAYPPPSMSPFGAERAAPFIAPDAVKATNLEATPAPPSVGSEPSAPAWAMAPPSPATTAAALQGPGLDLPAGLAALWEDEGLSAGAGEGEGAAEHTPARGPTPGGLGPATEPAQSPERFPRAPAGEPPAGERHVVAIEGGEIRFPSASICVHCLRTPAVRALAAAGSVPSPNTPSGRRTAQFNLPLCASCRNRASARSEEEKAARLQAFLVAAVLALAAVAIPLVSGLIDLGANTLASAFFLLMLAVVGFTASLVLLLGRASRFPPPDDALYIHTTLLVAAEEAGPRTRFAWRNRGYADLFRQVNRKTASDAVAEEEDRIGPFPGAETAGEDPLIGASLDAT